LEKHTHVVVGVSGGIDSLVLLHLLRVYNKRYQRGWHLTAVHIDPGFPGWSWAELQRYLERTEVDQIIVHTNVHRRISKLQNKCFVCARDRHRKLIETAEMLDTFHIALAHHQDDIAETLLLNMFYAGRISTLMPRQSVVQGRFILVRPLYYLNKAQIAAIAHASRIRALDMPCPYYKNSKRESIRGMLGKLKQKNPDIYTNIFRSIFNIHKQYMPS
jgi:tRNA 2-thiocytidine biosynthesis protein TtcA